MKIELKNGEIINTISDFNYSINDCLSCKHSINDKCKNIDCGEEDNISYYEFVGIKSIEIKEIDED